MTVLLSADIVKEEEVYEAAHMRHVENNHYCIPVWL